MNVRYSKATKEKVLALRAKGVTYENISKKTKVPVPTVGYWIRGTETKAATPVNVRPVMTEEAKNRLNLEQTRNAIAALQSLAEYLGSKLPG